MPHPLDSTVKKILNNGGFMAALMPLLRASTPLKSVRSAAKRLGRHATAYVKMLTALGYSVKVEDGWGGCEQAQMILKWIDEGITENEVAGVMEQMSKWTNVLQAAIADLALGKLPT